MYFDSHAHLDDARFEADFDEILARMKENGVTAMMNIGCDLPSSENSVRLAETYPWVWAAVGSHPDDADHVDVPRDVQKTAFRMQMALAQELSLPVVVHEREAHEDGLRIVDEFPGVKGVFHCYSGSLEMAKELVKRGWYIGFTGVVTFKNARKAVEVAENIPLDRILIETDCPYMAPEPYRGRRNDPSLVPFVAAKIAQLRGLTPEEVGKATGENARRLFRIEEGK